MQPYKVFIRDEDFNWFRFIEWGSTSEQAIEKTLYYTQHFESLALDSIKVVTAKGKVLSREKKTVTKPKEKKTYQRREEDGFRITSSKNTLELVLTLED